MKREMEPGKDLCRICGQPIRSDQRFYRDDPRPGEREPVDRWVHRDCFVAEFQRTEGKVTHR